MMIEFVADSALRVSFPGEVSREMTLGIFGLLERLQREFTAPSFNFHPAFCSLLIEFDPRRTSPHTVKSSVEKALRDLNRKNSSRPRRVVIPVRYDGEDLAEVATNAGLAVEEVIALHSSAEYTVAFLGFAPNFPYMIGLPGPLHVPRLSTARTQVPAGAVAIAGSVCGIYPEETPGGWRLIGTANPEFQFQPGDLVRFVPTSSIPARSRVKVLSGANLKGWCQVVDGGEWVCEQGPPRDGLTHLGISPGGAADRVAFNEANRLVGNIETAVALEVVSLGSVDIEFVQDTWFAVTGAPVAPTLDQMPIQMWASLPVSAGQRLSLHPASCNFRCYVGIHQGSGAPNFRKSEVLLREPYLESQSILRVTRGPQWHWFGAEAQARSGSEVFQVTSDLNRRGVRLQGPSLDYAPEYRGREMVSEGISDGAIQVMPDGQPVILFCEQRTTGGYPKIANVIAADLYRVAQLRPGQTVQLQEISLEDAWALST